MTLHNDSAREICSITACFMPAFRVGARPNIDDPPIQPGEVVVLDVPSCGDRLQAESCDHQRTFYVRRDDGGDPIMRIP